MSKRPLIFESPECVSLTYEDVFGHLAGETFTVAEAAEYLDMSVPNFRRYVRRGQITPAQTVGRNQLFGTRDLRALKHALNARRAIRLNRSNAESEAR